MSDNKNVCSKCGGVTNVADFITYPTLYAGCSDVELREWEDQVAWLDKQVEKAREGDCKCERLPSKDE